MGRSAARQIEFAAPESAIVDGILRSPSNSRRDLTRGRRSLDDRRKLGVGLRSITLEHALRRPTRAAG